MAIVKLAIKSLYNRRGTALLTIFAIAVSVSLLLGVERVRTQAKESFANTISGTDLIIGARTGSIQLLLYSVFRMGNATNNISWQSYEEISKQKSVKWSVPLSLGDSHRGYRVLGTNTDYFKYYQFGQSQPLQFNQGQPFESLFEAVIGSEVAAKLQYKIGDKIVIAHGSGSTSFTKHEQMPFTISGILAPTSTPVDKTVHVSLPAIEAIHLGWNNGAPPVTGAVRISNVDIETLQPTAITAALIGMSSKIRVFQLQRMVNQYKQEPLQAIIPGVALHELWRMMGVAEQALVVISGFVVASGLLGMLTMILASLNERRREMAILRAVGARPWQIFMLMISEAGLLALAGALVGVATLFSLLAITQPILQQQFGILISVSMLTAYEWKLLGLVILSGVAIGVIPSIQAYRMSLADGMTIRV
ncbi:ABC transporter permease [Alkalimarinus sediminis]|uniref:ABC transporter permease n=1 Tax=Alkalimarinus sediminis TaxID=1632866 RepID=A0A9E8HNW7_9ALTE|nr:ABC transporter permease [Alkalimarinus sediminis]UZW73766.1 ABC transporter permease [Alkalimarinus sediminis]